MKNHPSFKEQTECIVNFLLQEFSGVQCAANRMSFGDETDSGGAHSFDVAIIAGRLRELGDKFNGDLEASARSIAETSLRQEAGTKFQEVVESLSKTWCAQDPSLVYERAFLAVSVKLLEYVVRKAPQISRQLATSMTNMIDHGLQEYIQGQGGWENLES
ncbi:bcl-2-like protein 15 [Sorex fumeus]|uniref:bcl-2-like protein 15 n=1 Tax=Sorex fumeus TaxID=62283 RepID=UPI0024ADC457|nr:bcl-2-like protein 15 [Sorex fumeus]